MTAIRLYRHPDCARCASYARIHRRLDWFGRVEHTTVTPPTGPLQPGEIAVQELRTARTLRGIECVRLLCRQIPLYWAVLPFTHIPAVRARIEREVGACADGACELPVSTA